MTRGLIVLVAAATIGAAVLPSAPAEARGRGGAVAAGIIGGLAAGAIIGSAAAGSGPAYYEPAPVYAAPPPPACYWTRGEPVWDAYRGVWRRPRIQVCD